MASPLAVYHVKDTPLTDLASETFPEVDLDLTFNLDLEHRVWLAKFQVDRHNRETTDPFRLDWDGYEPELCLPDLWQPSWLDSDRWGSNVLRPNDRRPHPSRGWGPMPGDRVVAFRSGSHSDVVGVWLITGARMGADGSVSYSHRPLVSCLEPVALKPELRFDADLAECWDDTFGRRSRRHGPFRPLEGLALSSVMRTVGIDPQLLCGPANLLPDCAMSNVVPERSYRPATFLRTGLSPEARAEERAMAEAIDWLVGPDPLCGGFADVETVASTTGGVCLVARDGDRLHEVVAVGIVGESIDDIELCPTLVYEAIDAAEQGRSWSLVVTLGATGSGRTIRFDALAVAACFDPQSGRVGSEPPTS